ncbi:MAG: hypothetical protein KAT35_01475 [Candidatus Aenigmarchaeota archaeon]|nr:hypothetical protein [Candidatus Aenigmarchaeota archaeon]
MGRIGLFVMLAVFAALLLAGCMSSAPPNPIIGNVNPVGVANWWSGWESLAVIGLLISTFIVAIIYMVGSFMRHSGILAWCKVELYQIAMTTLMVVGLVALVWTIASINTSVIGISCYVPVTVMELTDPADPDAGVVPVYSGTGGVTLEQECNMFDFSMVYLKWMRQQTWILYQRLLFIYQKYAFLSSMTYGAALGGIGPVLQPMVWLQPVLNYTTLVLNFIAPALVLIMVIIELLRYIQFGMLNILLPIGIICRCFSPLRDFGGALMGISIALFLFFPLTFVINAAVIMPSTSDPFYMDYVDEEVRFENKLNDMRTDIDEENLGALDMLARRGKPDPDLVEGETANNLDKVKAAWNKWIGGTWYHIGVMWSGLALPGTLRFGIAHVVLGALVLPILNFMIVITAARELSRFLGEEVDITNLTRMI